CDRDYSNCSIAYRLRNDGPSSALLHSVRVVYGGESLLLTVPSSLAPSAGIPLECRVGLDHIQGGILIHGIFEVRYSDGTNGGKEILKRFAAYGLTTPTGLVLPPTKHRFGLDQIKSRFRNAPAKPAWPH